LRDRKAQARIVARLDSAKLGNLGDWKAVGGGVREMRIHVGAGYRLYFVQRQSQILILLCGGAKSSQRSDIAKAKHFATEIEGD
jgi:putative addiction module killer protein